MPNIKLLRNTIVDGEHVDAYQITQCSDNTARTLISMGKAVIVPDANNTDDKATAKAKKSAVKAAKKSTQITDTNPAVAQQDVVDAVLALDEDNDNNYELDMVTPKLAVVSALAGREITAAELQDALAVIDQGAAAE